jgi:hypothetical protein
MNLRAAGKNTAALDGALAAMELTPADGATIELAKDMAHKLDVTTDDRLAVRFSAHYARLLADLQRRSDANVARRRAAEEAERKAEAARERSRTSWLARMRRERHQAQRGQESSEEEAKTRARVRRWARGGMTLREISLRMGGVDEEYVHGFLTAEQQKQLGPPVKRGGTDVSALTEEERKLLERGHRDEQERIEAELSRPLEEPGPVGA